MGIVFYDLTVHMKTNNTMPFPLQLISWLPRAGAWQVNPSLIQFINCYTLSASVAWLSVILFPVKSGQAAWSRAPEVKWENNWPMMKNFATQSVTHSNRKRGHNNNIRPTWGRRGYYGHTHFSNGLSSPRLGLLITSPCHSDLGLDYY